MDDKVSIAYLYRGASYAALKHYQDAILDYTRVVEIDAQSPDAYNARAYVYFAQGNVEQAVTDVTKAIQLAPDAPNFYDSRCEFYLKSEQWALGVADCEKALDLGWTFSGEMQSLLETAYEKIDALTFTPRP